MAFILTFATQVSLLLCLISFVLANPLPSSPSVVIPLSKRIVGRAGPDGSVADLPWLKAHENHIIGKYNSTLTAFEVNTGTVMPGMSSIADRLAMATSKLLSRASAGEALVDEQGGSFWQGAITVGTPPQTFNMDFDSGSSDLWIQSAQSCSSCTATNKYSASSSSTASDQGRTFQISYGDGSMTSGEVYTETVSVAGLKVTKQAIGSATSVSSGSGASFDGLVGMAYQSISTEKAPPLFATMVSQGVVSTGSFSFRLSTSGSELYLGGVNTAKYSGAITYNAVTQQQYWQITMASVNANGKATVTNRQAIIDTGTTVVYGDLADVKAFYASYPSAVALSTFGYSSTTYNGYYAVPCTGTAYASLTFNGVAYPIPTAIFTGLGSVGTKGGVQYCVGGFIGSGSLGLGTAWLVGDVFLQAVYTNFDLTNNRVGFATPK